MPGNNQPITRGTLAGMAMGAWEYDRDDDALRAAAIIAMDRLAPPDFHVEVVSSRGDHLTVQIASGSLTDPAAILYVEGRGTFEIVRVEPWPDRRVMLVLRACPNRA
jgi:hypothetical protein